MCVCAHVCEVICRKGDEDYDKSCSYYDDILKDDTSLCCAHHYNSKTFNCYRICCFLLIHIGHGLLCTIRIRPMWRGKIYLMLFMPQTGSSFWHYFPGACPTNGISIEFEIRSKFSDLVKYMFDQSQRNFAHVTTVTLSWRGHNFFVVGRVHFKPEHGKFWSNFEFDRNIVGGTGAWQAQKLDVCAAYESAICHPAD